MNTDETNDDLKKGLEEELEADKVEIEPTEGSDDLTVDEDGELSTGEIVKKMRAKLKVAVEEKQKYMDGWQRDKAEFINVRKRDEEAKVEFKKFAEEKVIEDLLPIADSFESALAHAAASGAESSQDWQMGVNGIYQQLQSMLNKYGVESFGKKGDKFDPNNHHSIGMTSTTAKDEDHTISDVLQKGFLMRGKVLRPALVKVFEL